MARVDRQSNDDGAPVTTDGSLNEMVEQLRRIGNLLSLLITRDKTQAEQIRLLNAAGYPTSEIATLLGTTRNTVSVTLSQQKASTRARVHGRSASRATKSP